MKNIDFNSSQIQLTIILKLNQLKRNSLSSLSYEHLEDALRYYKWSKKSPSSLHEAVNDILSLTVDEIVKVAAQRAILDGSKKQISDFSDLLGG